MHSLVDSKGRKVVVNLVYDGGSQHLHFFASSGADLEEVGEATIVRSDKEDWGLLVPDVEFFKSKFEAEGIQWKDSWFHPRGTYKTLEIAIEDGYKNLRWSYYSPRTDEDKYYKVDGVEVTKKYANTVQRAISQCDGYDWLISRWPYTNSGDGMRSSAKVSLSSLGVLMLIGEGKVVTPESLVNMCAKDETRPRLWPGDNVEIKMAKGTILGMVTSLASKVSIVRPGGKKSTVNYWQVERTDKSAFENESSSNLDPVLKSNFDYVLAQTHRIYKAQLKVRESLTLPAFPTGEEKQWEILSVRNAPTCECPLCGWPMANFKNDGEFQCSMCKVRGIIARQDDDAVTLLMLRQPAKNRFAIREAKCCGNCGLFKFEYGCQGKRSTGYCSATNQCVQAHTTCVGVDGQEGYWFPRPPEVYSKQMTQHVTNLGYGVVDSRNTGRHDIKETIYTKQDHDEQRKRAEEARRMYEVAHSKFMGDLAKLADGRVALSDELTDEQKTEVREHFQKVLDDGC